RMLRLVQRKLSTTCGGSSSIRRFSPSQPNLPKEFLLLGRDFVRLDQLQDGQKQSQQPSTRMRRREDITKWNARAGRKQLEDAFHVNVLRRLVDDDLPRREGARLTHEPAEGASEVPQFHALERLVSGIEARHFQGGARQAGQLPLRLLFKEGGGFLVLL